VSCAAVGASSEWAAAWRGRSPDDHFVPCALFARGAECAVAVACGVVRWWQRQTQANAGVDGMAPKAAPV
jgi:hypothetical protein